MKSWRGKVNVHILASRTTGVYDAPVSPENVADVTKVPSI